MNAQSSKVVDEATKLMKVGCARVVASTTAVVGGFRLFVLMVFRWVCVVR